jgi:transcriptional regulator of acetoin/glycerol metabolism
MAGRRSELGAYVQVDPTKAKAKILDASRETRGCVRDMAKTLEVSECTLHRMIGKLDIRDEVKIAGAGSK